MVPASRALPIEARSQSPLSLAGST
jgi:hypothetical protein